MKIIATQNQAKETVSDVLVADRITHKEYGETMVRGLNDRYCTSDSSYWFYKLVEDDYKLYVFEGY